MDGRIWLIISAWVGKLYVVLNIQRRRADQSNSIHLGRKSRVLLPSGDRRMGRDA
jgi:hypothetical protein